MSQKVSKVDYSKGLIYKLCCKDLAIKYVYIGSTTNFRVRKNSHKYDCNNTNSKKYNLFVYKFIRENGGFDNWDMIMIEEYNCSNKKQLESRERFWYEKYNCNLNMRNPNRNNKEYCKIWYENNKNEYCKDYYNKNKKKILEQAKEYYKNNKDKILKK